MVSRGCLMCPAILSRSLEARREISTRKSMSFPEALLSLFEEDSFAASELFNPSPDCGRSFGVLQSLKQNLIAGHPEPNR
jgi:hypothetical protein